MFLFTQSKLITYLRLKSDQSDMISDSEHYGMSSSVCVSMHRRRLSCSWLGTSWTVRPTVPSPGSRERGYVPNTHTPSAAAPMFAPPSFLQGHICQDCVLRSHQHLWSELTERILFFDLLVLRVVCIVLLFQITSCFFVNMSLCVAVCLEDKWDALLRSKCKG